MSVEEQIQAYIASEAAPKRSELMELHHLAMQLLPGCQLWYDSGTNSEGKTVCNPTIGYGLQTLTYADGKTKEFFRIGISADKTGISVYVLGLKDKTYLAQTYGQTIGKASITSYCIKFKTLKQINIEVLAAAIQYGGANRA